MLIVKWHILASTQQSTKFNVRISSIDFSEEEIHYLKVNGIMDL